MLLGHNGLGCHVQELFSVGNHNLFRASQTLRPVALVVGDPHRNALGVEVALVPVGHAVGHAAHVDAQRGPAARKEIEIYRFLIVWFTFE